MTSKALQAADYVNVAMRRKWLILFLIAVSVSIAWGVCLVWPKSYRSTTTIILENQKIPESYVKGVVSGTIQERIASIRQVVLSRQLLRQVIDELKLMPSGGGDLVREGTEDALIAQMSKSIVVDNSKEQTVFKMSYAHANPRTARDVTAKLAALVVEENLKRREQLIEGATEFLNQELKLAKDELEGKEKAISEFKSRNMGELPQQMEASLRALDRLQIEMSTVSETINMLGSRLDAIEKSIHDFQIGDAPSSVALLTPTGRRRVDKRREQLRDLEQRLAVLSAEYKENYPDIVHLKEEIRKLKLLPSTPEEPLQEEIVVGENGKTRPIADPYLTELVRQRNEIKSELVFQRQKQARIASQIAELERRVERMPAREQQLMVLVRDYENLQKNYQSLLEKKIGASISESLERRQKGEQFRILDQANLPRQPETPNELMIMLAGLVVGCGIGYGSAFWLEYGRGLVRTPEDAESVAGLPILATIPDFSTAYKGGFPKALPASAYLSGGNSRPPLQSKSRATGATAPAPTSGDGVPIVWGRKSPLSRVMKNGLGDLRIELNLVAKWRPYSLAAEQYRVAATKIVMSSTDLQCTVIIVTSSIKGEGKSSSVSNLGYVLASDLGKRTLLIDCDFKCPSLHLYSGINSSPGLIEVLSGQCGVSDALQRAEDTGPWILPSGSRSRAVVDLGQIPKLKTIITELRGQFDYIVLDAPPVLPLADMNLLSALCDFTVLVVRADMTHKSVVETAVRTMRAVERGGVLITGCAGVYAPYYLQGYDFAGQGKDKE